MKSPLKFLILPLCIMQATCGLEFAPLAEPLLENSHLVGAWMVATAGIAAGSVHQKLTTCYAFKKMDQAVDTTVLDGPSQQFLKDFRQNNKGIISIDILIGDLNSANSPVIVTKTNINYPAPAIAAPKPKYIIAQSQPTAASGQQATSSTAMNNQQGTQFALMVNPNNLNNANSLTNAHFDALRIKAENLNRHRERLNQIAINNAAKDYLVSFTPSIRFQEKAREAYIGAVIGFHKEKQKDKDILKNNPDILNFDESIQWIYIALHLSSTDFINRFIIDPQMQTHRAMVKRLIEIIKTADQQALKLLLHSLFPADTFIKLFPIILERAQALAHTEVFEDRLLEINNYKNLFQDPEKERLEELVNDISRFREAIATASSLLGKHTSFWWWGPTPLDSQQLLAIFTAFHRSKLKNKLQAHFSKTSDYGTLGQIVAKIKIKEMQDYLASKGTRKNYLAYAFEIEEFITFVGPQINKNSKYYKQLMRSAEMQAFQNTLTSFNHLLELSRTSGISGNLLAQKYKDRKQKLICLNLIRLLAELRSRAHDAAAIDKLVHLGLIANKLGNIKEAEGMRDLLLCLQKIYVTSLAPRADIAGTFNERSYQNIIKNYKSPAKNYSITPSADKALMNQAATSELPFFVGKLRYNLQDGTFSTDLTDEMIAINVPVTVGTEDKSSSSSATFMPPMLDPDSDSEGSECDEDIKTKKKLTFQEFQEGVEKLKQKYGESKVDEILSKFDHSQTKVEKSNNLLEMIEVNIKMLEIINSEPRWSTLPNEPGNKGKVNLNNIKEARAGVAAEEQGYLQKLQRSRNRGEEFVDINGQAWDVKSPSSRDVYNTMDIFDLNKVIDSIIKEYALGENPIINISHLNKKHSLELMAKLSTELTTDQKARTLIIDYFVPANSGFFK